MKRVHFLEDRATISIAVGKYVGSVPISVVSSRVVQLMLYQFRETIIDHMWEVERELRQNHS